jgi:hypothetical protein
VNESDIREGYSSSNVTGRTAVLVGCGFIVCLFATSMFVFGFYKVCEGWLAPSRELRDQAQPRIPPPPRLQIDPSVDEKELEAAEETRLHTYGWVDRKRGIARVPIERAMDAAASHVSLPAVPPQAASPRGGREAGAWEGGGPGE